MTPNATTSPQGLRELIVSHLETKIAQGEMVPGDKLPARAALAEEFGVSSLTVTAAIRELVQKGLVEHLSGKGVYVASPAEQEPEMLTIGFIGWYASHPEPRDQKPAIGGYWQSTFEAVCRFAHQQGYGAMLIPNTDSEPIPMDSVVACHPGLVISVGIQLRPETVFELRRRNIKLLLANRHLEELGVSYVDYDTEGDFRRMIRIFHERGHRRIGVIHHGMNVEAVQRHCFEGFCSELAQRDCNYPYVRYWRDLNLGGHAGHPPEPSSSWRNAARNAMRDMLDLPEPPTAIYCRNHLLAEGICDAAAERGLRIGKDLSLLGESDGDDSPTWSHFRTPHEEMDQEMVSVMQKMIESPHCVFQADIPKVFVDKGTIASLNG